MIVEQDLERSHSHLPVFLFGKWERGAGSLVRVKTCVVPLLESVIETDCWEMWGGGIV